MILDEDCFEELRGCMRQNLGIVAGYLRDPLVGRTCCIKMYRKECFEKVKFKDSISPDVDFREDILKYGWGQVYVLRFLGISRNLWHTFGEHRPLYTPFYTYSKYLVEGRKWRYRKSFRGMMGNWRRLGNSPHEMALVAQIAMCHGIFMEGERDVLRQFTENEDFNFLESFLKSSGSFKINKLKPFDLLFLTPKTLFKQYYRLGINLRNENAFPAFKCWMDLLNKSNEDFAWIANVGLCHGLFYEHYSKDVFENDYIILKELIPKYNWLTLLRKKFKHLKRLLTLNIVD
ncbi:MAG: hypothetical protein ACREOW_03030 [Thermodesulfobacteriota bacterium]